MKCGTRVRLKPSNNRGEFEFDQAKSKNNISENSVALGHETHNNLTIKKSESFFRSENGFDSFQSMRICMTLEL